MPTLQGLAGNLGGDLACISVQFTYLDLQQLTSGSGAKTLNLFNILTGPPYNTSKPLTFPQGSMPVFVRVKHSVAFAGGSLSGMTVSVGKTTGAATTQYTTAFNIFQAVADTTLQETANPTNGQLSAVTPTVTFTPTGDNCSAATAGVVNIDFLYYNMTTVGQVSNGVQVSPNPL